MFDPKTRILVVDDMMTMRKVVAKTCRDLGFTDVTEAVDGVDAWKKMDADNKDGEKKPHMYHIVTNPHIEFIDKDHARYYAYWMGILETGGEIVTAGREVNELVKINGRWLISIRDVDPGN